MVLYKFNDYELDIGSRDHKQDTLTLLIDRCARRQVRYMSFITLEAQQNVVFIN